MLKNKKSMELSVTVIIAAVIGLIVLVVLIGIFTGRLNIYSSGVNELTTCKNTCKNIGADNHLTPLDRSCNSDISNRRDVIPGTFSDVGKGRVCCCGWRK